MDKVAEKEDLRKKNEAQVKAKGKNLTPNLLFTLVL